MRCLNLPFLLSALWLSRLALSAAEPVFAVRETPDQLVITSDGRPVATYVFRDEKVLRPYFCNVHAPGGLQASRRHPPVPGQDATDHDSMHPGLWLAFGDICGQDFWRNKAVIKHTRFTAPPAVRNDRLTFATENQLQTTNGQTLGTQMSRVSLTARPDGYLLIWEATFAAGEQEMVFGDQEEMGLGVRLATPLTEKNGGVISSSSGLKTAKNTWGKAFDWCDYSGVIGHQRVGVTVMTDPTNFRPSWFHNRDYGLMVANPFGRKSMKQGDASRVEVKRGQKLRLRFGLLLHSAPTDQHVDLAAAYSDFLVQTLIPPP